MTVDEYRQVLARLTPEQFKALCDNFGGAENTIEARVRQFAYANEKYPDYDRIIVYWLTTLGVTGLMTEQDKHLHTAQQTAAAARESADAAKTSAEQAKESARAAWYSVGAALLTIVATLTLQRCG
jgi:hypothetical protein